MVKRRNPKTRKIETVRYWQNKSPHELGPPPRPVKRRTKNGQPKLQPPPS